MALTQKTDHTLHDVPIQHSQKMYYSPSHELLLTPLITFPHSPVLQTCLTGKSVFQALEGCKDFASTSLKFMKLQGVENRIPSFALPYG